MLATVFSSLSFSNAAAYSMDSGYDERHARAKSGDGSEIARLGVERRREQSSRARGSCGRRSVNFLFALSSPALSPLACGSIAASFCTYFWGNLGCGKGKQRAMARSSARIAAEAGSAAVLLTTDSSSFFLCCCCCLRSAAAAAVKSNVLGFEKYVRYSDAIAAGKGTQEGAPAANCCTDDAATATALSLCAALSSDSQISVSLM